jgi:HNH endonuclease/AP2 domain
MKEVPLTRGKVALVDDEDFERVAAYKWCYMTVGYAARSVVEGKKRRLVYLHRFILRPEKGAHIDHIDGNKLNNQRNNLRTCTHQQNMRNRTNHRNNTSGHKGVAFDKSTGIWKAYINIDGKTVHLGRFPTAELAAEYRNGVAEKVFGEFNRKPGA